ncbi:hypothetical protein, partial [Candidatus Cyrtobacter comes]|uniref:hypothetical protein n=1 Tax=Candidatus Cyrtobacter comes TaxID=675776 RepID=UPI002ACDBE27
NPFIERFNVDRKQPFIHLNTIFIASNIILHLFHYLAKPLLTVPNTRGRAFRHENFYRILFR